jgi:serine/threonine-protein kinase RsbW
VSTATAAALYSGVFCGRPDQVGRVRRAVARHLGGCPVAGEAVLIVSELAANAVLHSDSRDEFFTVRVELFRDYVWLECEDMGGDWQCKSGEDPFHGLSIINTLAGPDNWGVDGGASGRVVWVRLDFPASG